MPKSKLCSEQLGAALLECGQMVIELNAATSILRSRLSEFIRDQGVLSQTNIDLLDAHLELELLARQQYKGK
jgi:hypothetical protein